MAVSSTSSGSLKTGVCLSTDRPDNPYNGQVIYETDTNRVLVYDNSAWVVVANAASTGFPSSLDTNTVDSIAALQAKVGVDSSAVTSSLDYKVAQLEAISHGKILQVVRATDTTDRTTTSTSFVDANISVTITPTSASSNIILIWTHRLNTEVNAAGFVDANTIITDSSNNKISGAQHGAMTTRNFTTTGTPELRMYEIRIGYDSPATTSATTYKGRFACGVAGQTARLKNTNADGQMFAIEVGA